jgi:putative oxidoreductase
MLLLGLATRVAAIPLIITMIVAIRTALWPDIGGLNDLLGQVEFLYIALLLWLSVGGAGAISLDFLIARRIGSDRTAAQSGLATPALAKGLGAGRR